VTEGPTQLLPGRLQLAPDAAHAAWPCILAQRVDHRSANAALRERLELDSPRVIEAVRGIDQADHAVLHQVAQVDRVWHGGGHAAGQSLHKGNAGFNAWVGNVSRRGHLMNLRCLP